MGIRNFIYRAAIRAALRKPAPSSFPISMPGARANDFYTVNLDEPDRPNLSVLILRPEGANYSGYYFNGRSSSAQDATVLGNRIDQYNFRARYYLKGYEFGYRSPLRMLLDYYTGYPHLQIARDKLAQHLFNRRSIVRKDRIELLRMFVDETTKDRSFTMSNIRVVETVHSLRSFSHPQRDETLNYYELLLDSMRHDGHLRYESYRYALNAAGMSALDRYMMEEKRHSQGIKIQRTLALLTGALIFVGLLQAYIAYAGD